MIQAQTLLNGPPNPPPQSLLGTDLEFIHNFLPNGTKCTLIIKIKCPSAVLKGLREFRQTPPLNSNRSVLPQPPLGGNLHGSCFCSQTTWQGSGVLTPRAERPRAQRLFAKSHSPGHPLLQAALGREEDHRPWVPGGSAALWRGKLRI